MHRPGALVLLLLAAAPGAAQVKFDAEAHARAVAPYLDEQTVAIVHVDLARLDIDKAAARLGTIGKVEVRDLEALTGPLSGWLPALAKAGGKDLYLVLSLADVPADPPFVVVPVAGGDGRAIAAALKESKLFAQAEQVGSAVAAGGERTLKRLRDLKPAARPEVARAFAGAGDASAQLLLLPTADLRRAYEETMPTLPKQFGGGSIRTFTRGISWAAVSADAAPEFSLRLVIQSPDAAAAKSLREALAGILKLAAEDKEVREHLPGVDKLLPQLTPAVAEDRLTLTLGEKELVAVLQPLLAQAHGASARTQSVGSLKQLGLALHNYHDDHKAFPPATSRDKQGKPLLSWRVHLLPYLGQGALYKEFRLDEPWDSEHNKKLIARMPAVFRGPNRKLSEEGKTPYVAPVGAVTVFTGGPKGIRFADIVDGTSNTILLVEADDEHAVIWTKPDDIKYDPKQPQAGLAEHKPGGYVFLFADGSVHLVPSTIDKKMLHALFTRAGGEVVTIP